MPLIKKSRNLIRPWPSNTIPIEIETRAKQNRRRLLRNSRKLRRAMAVFLMLRRSRCMIQGKLTMMAIKDKDSEEAWVEE